jgi:predicted nucleic-acid-binding protein
MLGVDTNVLVRFLVRDDAQQFEIVHKMLEREALASRRVFISQLVLQEMEWVLRSRYGFSKSQILGAVSSLLDAMDFELEDEAAVEQAIFIWKDHSAGFWDCLIGARNQRMGCATTATFDVKASRLPWFVEASSA